MVWLVVGCAVAVLATAAYAGMGKLGQMPHTAVNDRPKGYLPEGPITLELLDQLRLPGAWTGYERAAVDAHLRAVARQEGELGEASFPVVRGGYDMQAVDELLDRPRRSAPETLSPDEPIA